MLVLAVVATARADLSFSCPKPALSVAPASCGISAASTVSVASSQVRSSPTDPLGVLDGTLGVNSGSALFGHADGADAVEVRTLPVLPSSANLLLSAALTMGAWQVVRSTRYLHLSVLPEWYHTGGPGQIGHAVAIDMQFAPATLCVFSTVVRDTSQVRYRLRDELVSPVLAKPYLIAADPRGPPSC